MSVSNIGITKPWNEASVSAGAEISAKGSLQLKPQITPGIKLQLNYDTEDMNRYVVDESGNHDAIFFREDAQIDTAQKQFGVASYLSDGNADGFEILDGLSDFEIGSGSFTIHTWVRYEEAPFATTRVIFNLGGGVPNWNTTNGHSFLLYTSTTNYNVDYNSGGSPISLSAAGDGALVIRTWTHIAMVNDAVNNTFRVFIGGVKKIDTTAITVTSISNLLSLLVGGAHSGTSLVDFSFDGHIDATYVVPGVALWTDDFTPPTAPEGAFLTSAQSGETDAYTTDESFNSDDITVKLGRTPAAATEIKVAVNVDGGGFGAFINVDVTPIAGETAWFKLAVGTSFTPGSTVILKVQLNSPDNTTQLEVIEVKIKGITIAGAVCDYAAASDLRLGVEQDFGNITGTAAIPAKADTRKDTPVDDGVGTLAVAPASDVRENVPTDATVGNYVPAIEDNHALGDSYGSNGTEFTGKKALTPFKLPVDVILEDSEILVFEGAE